MDICIRCQPRTEVSPTPPTAARAALRRRRRLFAEPLCFEICFQMVSFRGAHVFHDILCCWRRNRSPAPAPLVFEFDVGDDGAVDALGVRSGGNVLGELQNSDSRVDASDFDTGICSRLTYNTYSYSYLLKCLSDAGTSSLHACSTSLSRACMFGR